METEKYTLQYLSHVRQGHKGKLAYFLHEFETSEGVWNRELVVPGTVAGKGYALGTVKDLGVKERYHGEDVVNVQPLTEKNLRTRYARRLTQDENIPVHFWGSASL
jgi:hypothetical protein